MVLELFLTLLGVIYGIGLLVFLLLPALALKSVFAKSFSLAGLLKKALKEYSENAGFALVIGVIIVLNILVSTLFGVSRFTLDFADSLEEPPQELIIIGVSSLAIALASLILIIHPLMLIENSYVGLAHSDYKRRGRITKGLWKKLLTKHAVNVVLLAFMILALQSIGLLLFFFPFVLVSWAVVYAPFLITLKGADALSALNSSVSLFRKKPWDAIFFTTLFVVVGVLFRSFGIESFVGIMVFTPIIGLMISEYLQGVRV